MNLKEVIHQELVEQQESIILAEHHMLVPLKQINFHKLRIEILGKTQTILMRILFQG